MVKLESYIEVVVAVTEYGGGKGGVVFGELLRGVD